MVDEGKKTIMTIVLVGIIVLAGGFGIAYLIGGMPAVITTIKAVTVLIIALALLGLVVALLIFLFRKFQASRKAHHEPAQ